MKRSERLHALSEMLRRQGPRGCSAERLAAEFGVSVRTVKRDLAALDSSGVPVWSRPGPGGGYGLAGRSSLPPVSLSPAQAVSLLAAVSAAPDAPYSDLATAAVQKILDVLDPRTRERAEQLADRVWINVPPAPSRAVMSPIEQAMTDQRVLRIRYAAGGGAPGGPVTAHDPSMSRATSTREVEPVLFGSTAGHWYLIGWCRLRDAMRWFRLDRIQHAAVTAEPCSGHTVDEVGAPPDTARPVHGRGEPVRSRGER